MGRFHQLSGGHQARHQVHKVRIIGALQPQGIGLLVFEDIFVGVFREAVLQLLGSRGLPPVQNPLLRRDLPAGAEAQIPGRQGFQIDHASGAVGQRVEKLHGNPIAEVHHPQAAGVQLLLLHQRQGVGIILPDLGRLGELLQIVPEEAGPQPHVHGGKAGHQLRRRLLQQSRIHRLLQRGGDPEHVDPAAAPDRGKDQRGVIQPHPLFAHTLLRYPDGRSGGDRSSPRRRPGIPPRHSGAACTGCQYTGRTGSRGRRGS